MHIDDTQLRNFLTDAGLASRSRIEEAEKIAEEKQISLTRALLSLGVITEDELRRLQAYTVGFPFISLKGQKVAFDTLSLIPEPIARKHNIVSYHKVDGTLEVAMLDTDDLQAIDFIKKKTGLKILPRLTDSESIKEILLQYQRTLKDEFGELITKESDNLRLPENLANTDEVSAGELKKIAEDLPVVRIVSVLLKHAILQDASDIHIEPMENKVLIRYRIDGILHDAMTLPKNTGASITARIKVLSNLKLDERRLPQDGRFKMILDEGRVSFRVSTLPTFFGEKTVMRLLREERGGFTLEALGFYGEALESVHKGLKATTGMLLTTGPTGSGKTTTLYTALDILNKPGVNISTIEDPVEYQMPRVNQTQVRADIGFTFSTGLRALVRQDPDIIMVGEIRDTETASLAVNAALTGHLVLSTLHTNSAAGAVPRLVEMSIEPFLLGSTINVIIAQRLVRKLCEEKDAYTLSKAEVKDLQEKINVERVLDALRKENIIDSKTGFDDLTFHKAKPSSESEDGYKGRIGIYEVLPMTSAIRELIMQNKTAEDIEARARKDGMLTMMEDGVVKAVRGVTTLEEVLRVVNE
jgi:type IV pilus assembly protein PilB